MNVDPGWPPPVAGQALQATSGLVTINPRSRLRFWAWFCAIAAAILLPAEIVADSGHPSGDVAYAVLVILPIAPLFFVSFTAFVFNLMARLPAGRRSDSLGMVVIALAAVGMPVLLWVIFLLARPAWSMENIP
jgi:hypothetical protein